MMIELLRRRRRNRALLRHAEEIEQLFREVNHAEPCPDPDCMAFRERIKAIVIEEGPKYEL